MANAHLPILDTTWVAEESLLEAQYHFVAQGATPGGMVLADASGPAVGVLQDKPDEGEAGHVIEMGIATVITGDDVAAGEWVKPDSSGHAVPCDMDATSTEYVAGRARTSATSGGRVTILLEKFVVVIDTDT